MKRTILLFLSSMLSIGSIFADQEMRLSGAAVRMDEYSVFEVPSSDASLLTQTPSYPKADETVTQKFVFSSSIKASAPISLRLAALGGKLKIKVGEGQATEYTVSESITKLTPVTLRSGVDNPRVEIDGALIAIDCKGAQLTEIDCSSATELQLLEVSENELQRIDLSACANLRYAYMMNNQIDILVVGQLRALEEFNVSFNKINSVDLRPLASLKSFSCDRNMVEDLDLSGNPLLENLYCKKNKIKSLDLSKQSKLTELSCEGNKIERLDLSHAPNLRTLYAKDNVMTSVDLSANRSLEEINLSSNKLSRLDTELCPQLLELYCFDNELSELNLDQNKQLTTLSCGGNMLQRLDLSDLKSLESLSVSFNQLEEIKLNGCSALQSAALDHNNLKEMDFASCSSLMFVDISFNGFVGAKALETVNSLPARSSETPGVLVYLNKREYWQAISGPSRRQAVLVYLNKREYPEDEEHNELDEALLAAAKARCWTMLDGETPLSSEEVLPDRMRVYLADGGSQMLVEGAYESAMLFSVDGVVVSRLPAGQTQLSLSGLSRGHYILQLRLPGGQSEVHKIVLR
ncbi:MAG: hypothetical protein SPI72_02565 [Porphyromonas sp.]|nr:hypothetical protein [Porphyromonas sp.]